MKLINLARHFNSSLIQIQSSSFSTNIPKREPITSIPDLLKKHQTAPELEEVIENEKLLSLGLLNKIDNLYHDYSNLSTPSPQLFNPSKSYSGIQGFRSIIKTLKEHNILIDGLEERECFINVYRFLATGHILNQVNWGKKDSCSVYHLFFPQKDMLPSSLVSSYLSTPSSEKPTLLQTYLHHTNPHDGNQLLNKPYLHTADGKLELLEGCQHKYPQCILTLDSTCQNCFAFCTYCFRHAQVRQDADMFAQKNVHQVLQYLREHKEITDLLLTGGDAGFMSSQRLRMYVQPIMMESELSHICTVRIGSRALTYKPSVVLGSEEMCGKNGLVREMAQNGVQLSWMGHFSSPRELLNPLTLAAIQRLRNCGAIVRSQSPIMKHISMFEGEDGQIDVKKSAKNWIDLANLFSRVGIGFHSMYCPRPTGESEYFTAPIAKINEIFSEIYRSLPSLNRPSRYISMTISAGKFCILGTTEVHGEKMFALKFTEARDMKWMDKVFLAKYDAKLNNVGLLTPIDSDKFAFQDELEHIETELADKIAQAHSII
jgi:lysine 2,3-aminomutase